MFTFFFIGKYLEIQGISYTRKMKCTDNCEGRVGTQPGMCTWGYRARIRAARSFKQSPYLVNKKSNGRTTPQYER